MVPRTVHPGQVQLGHVHRQQAHHAQVHREVRVAGQGFDLESAYRLCRQIHRPLQLETEAAIRRFNPCDLAERLVVRRYDGSAES